MVVGKCGRLAMCSLCGDVVIWIPSLTPAELLSRLSLRFLSCCVVVVVVVVVVAAVAAGDCVCGWFFLFFTDPLLSFRPYLSSCQVHSERRVTCILSPFSFFFHLFLSVSLSSVFLCLSSSSLLQISVRLSMVFPIFQNYMQFFFFVNFMDMFSHVSVAIFG